MIIFKGFLLFGYFYVICICILFNICFIMYLILIMRFLLPLIHCLSFQRLLFLLFMVVIMSYFLVKLKIILSRRFFLKNIDFFYYLMSIIMEATEFLYWIITIYLFTINANNLLISVFQALFITTFYFFNRLFFCLPIPKRAHYVT